MKRFSYILRFTFLGENNTQMSFVKVSLTNPQIPFHKKEFVPVPKSPSITGIVGKRTVFLSLNKEEREITRNIGKEIVHSDLVPFTALMNKADWKFEKIVPAS